MAQTITHQVEVELEWRGKGSRAVHRISKMAALAQTVFDFVVDKAVNDNLFNNLMPQQIDGAWVTGILPDFYQEVWGALSEDDKQEAIVDIREEVYLFLEEKED